MLRSTVGLHHEATKLLGFRENQDEVIGNEPANTGTDPKASRAAVARVE
jgi:hypothetical protein